MPQLSKTSRFRAMLNSRELEFIMEAHNGLSARIVEEAGFSGIWGSGLSISAALGVRDNNEASWTQVLEVCEFISDATSIPMMLDGDTGYGNFNNVRRLVQKLEQRGVAAVCIEDKLFPKTNSFIKGEQQPLADIDEFCGKIKAAKDAQSDPDFSVVARIEAFIAGWGIDEMLKRAEAYYQAGADALLIHSKIKTASQVLAFAQAWDRDCPLVIVPTTYFATPVEEFEKAGISTVIWANHNLRSCISTMQRTCKQIFEERSLCSIEDNVVPVKEIFRLQNASELLKAEESYLPKRESTRSIVLATPQGRDFDVLTADKPKTMIEVSGKPILGRMVDQFREEGIKDIVVVRGFAKDQVNVDGVSFVDNDDFETTGELHSLMQANDKIEGNVVVSFGDIVFRSFVLNILLSAQEDIAIIVDTDWESRPSFNGMEDFVRVKKTVANGKPVPSADVGKVRLVEMDPSIAHDARDGEWVGLVKSTAEGSKLIQTALVELQERDDFGKLQMFDLFNHLLSCNVSVGVYCISGHWLDVDNLIDLNEAQHFAN
ncbi:MAG: phosphoenolpyruvate mutase [Planctomycetota bacterium]